MIPPPAAMSIFILFWAWASLVCRFCIANCSRRVCSAFCISPSCWVNKVCIPSKFLMSIFCPCNAPPLPWAAVIAPCNAARVDAPPWPEVASNLACISAAKLCIAPAFAPPPVLPNSSNTLAIPSCLITASNISLLPLRRNFSAAKPAFSFISNFAISPSALVCWKEVWKLLASCAPPFKAAIVNSLLKSCCLFLAAWIFFAATFIAFANS